MLTLFWMEKYRNFWIPTDNFFSSVISLYTGVHMIYFDKVSKEYEDDNTRSLHEVSFNINKGEFVSIVGHSGAGKTTITRMILGEIKPTEGVISFENTDIHNLRRSELLELRRRIGTVFQDIRLLPDKTVFENVAFAMEVSGKSDEEIAADVPYALELVNLREKAWRFPAQLSGGERQRVAIARAIINQPDVIIADEPTGNLDPKTAGEIIDIFKKINDLGTTVILTTHNKHIVDGLKKRVIALEHGKIIKDEQEGKYHM